MKKILLPLLAIMLQLAAANAQEKSKLVITAGSLKHLSLGDKMKIVLVKAGSEQTAVSFSKEVFEKLDVRFSKNSLHVESRSASNNDVVYIVVTDVESISLGQNTNVTNEGIWLSNNMELYVSDGATAKLKTTGQVKALPLGESSVNVSIRPLPFNASAKVF